MTLRITREEGPRFHATLRLEGNLVTAWAALLERECSSLLGARGAVSLDLAGVRFVDRAGLAALKRLSRGGVLILCRPGVVASVLEAEGIRVEQDRDSDDDGPR